MAFHVRSQRHASALKSQTNSQRSRRRIGRRPVFELLEERRLLALVTWDGGAGDNLWNSDANWSGNTLPSTNDDVVITESAPNLILLQGSSVSVNTLVASTSVSIGTALTVANGAQLSGIATLGPFTLTLGGQNSLGGLVVEHGGIVTAFDGQALQVTVQGDVSVASTGSISADARGFATGQGPGAGVDWIGPSIGSTGGGYGGQGGSNAGVAGGSTYGSIVSPTDLGSGAGNPYPGYGAGGTGGGAIKLEVDGELSLDGRISSNGGSATSASGGGSGGSVWLIAASLVGSGTISANGGNSGPNEGGGGGGGRVAICVMHAPNGPVPSAEAEGGNGYQDQAGQPGTVYGPLNCPIIGENFRIDPRGTYLHTNQDPASPPRIIDLQSLGITPGEMIELERLGDFNYVTSDPPSPELTAMIAVFSSSEELRERAQLHRVTGAIDAGVDISTISTFHGSQPTDIEQDFLVDGIVTISVPTGARYLFVAAHDEFYSDNSDTDNSGAGDYAIRVAKLPDADFDNDGVVDMADYSVWRANFGAISGAGLAADGNFDGQVNAADYVLWRHKLTSGMMAAVATGSLAPVAELSGSDEPTIIAAKSEIPSAESDHGGNPRQVDFGYWAQSEDIYRKPSAHYTGHRGGRVVGLPRTDNLAHTGRLAAIELLTQAGTLFSAKSAVSNEEDHYAPFNRGSQNESHLAVFDEAITHVEWCNSTGRNSFVGLHRKPS